MPTLVEVPNVGHVEFPDGMSQEDIQSALQRNFPPNPTLSQSENVAGAKMQGVGTLKATSKWDDFVHSPLMEKIIGQPSIVREAKEKFGAPVSSPFDIISSIMSPSKKAMLEIPKIPEVPNVNIPGQAPTQVTAGLVNAGIGALNSIIHDPLSFASLGAGGGIGKALAGLFGGQIASQVPEVARQAGTVSGDPNASLQQKVEAIGNLGTTIALPALAGKHIVGVVPLPKGVQEVKQTNPDLAEKTKAMSSSIYKPEATKQVPSYPIEASKPKQISPQTKTNEKELQGREMVLTGPFIARNAREEIGLDTSKASPEQTMNRLNNLTTQGKLSQTELQIYKDQGLEDFVKTKPTPDELAKWMEEKGPRVVVDKAGIGSEQYTDAQKRYRELNHSFWDSLSLTQKNQVASADRHDLSNLEIEDALVKDYGWNREAAKVAREYIEVSRAGGSKPGKGKNANWQSISPKEESKMPEYVEGAVTIPPSKNPFNGSSALEINKFPSSHSFPPNTLGFFRGYMEGDTFHIIEVQSDWAHQLHDLKSHEDFQDVREGSSSIGARAQYLQKVSKLNDPLLKDWERLTLKAAIQHAIGEGAKHVAVSDAETAMMSEGHDRGFEAVMFRTREEALSQFPHGEIVPTPDGEFIVREGTPSQSKGMRLHYDQILPRLLKELTGSEGKEVEFGEHKMAFDLVDRQAENGDVIGYGQGNQRKDLIFKDKSGAPKTSITAKSFDLTKAKERQAFSLFDKDKAPVESKTKQTVPDSEHEDSLKKQWTKRLGLDKPSTVGDVIRKIVKDKETYSEGTVALAKFLDDNFSHVIDSASVDSGSNKGVNRASYVPDEHKVYLDLGGKNSGSVIGTVLHESAHAAFHWLVETEKPVADKVSAIREQVVRNLPKAVGKFYKEVYLPNILKHDENVTFDQIHDWFEAHQLNADKWHEILYALQDNSEFAANIFNSESFRNFLNEIPAESQTLWAKVKEFVASALGIKPGTVLDKTLDTLLEGRDLYKDKGEMPDALRLAKDRLSSSGEKYTPPLPSDEKGGEAVDDLLHPFADDAFKLKTFEKQAKWSKASGKMYLSSPKQLKNWFVGKTLPKTMAASPEVGNALARFASADIAAPHIAEALATEVAGEHWNNVEFQNKVGAAFVEEMLNAQRQSFIERDDRVAAAKVTHIWDTPDSPIKDEKQFKEILKDPEVQATVARFKRLVQEPTTATHTKLGGKLSAVGPQTGVFINLQNHGYDEGQGFAATRKGELTNPLKQGSRTNKERRGTGKNYEFNLRNIIHKMIRANYVEGAKRDLYDAYEKSGLGRVVKSNEERPATLGGVPTQKITIDKGRGQTENLWVRNDVAGELRQALQTDSPVEKGVVGMLLDSLTNFQLMGPIDVTMHLRNMFSAINSTQGGESFIEDFFRKLPGYREVDTLVRVVKATKDVIMSDPKIQDEINDYVESVIGKTGVKVANRILRPVLTIKDVPQTQKSVARFTSTGAGRGMVQHSGLISKYIPTGKLVQIIDRAARLSLDRMYDNLVKRGLAKDTEEGRREYINRMGQYSPRLTGKVVNFLKELNISSFYTAGSQFNKLALQRITMNPGIEAASPAAAFKLRMMEVVGVVSTLLAAPAVINYYMTGSIWGRPGVKQGAIDTGKNDKNGNPIQYDPSQNDLLRRALRISGIEAARHQMREGSDIKDVLNAAIKDQVRGFASPFEGPGVKFYSTLTTGKDVNGYLQSDNPDSWGQNFAAALRNSNPSLARFFQERDKGEGKGKSALAGLTQPFVQLSGVSSATKPGLFEKELAIPEIEKQTISERAATQKKLIGEREVQGYTKRLEQANQREERSLEQEKQITNDLKPETKDWLSKNHLRVPGFAEFIEQTGVKVYLLPKEREQYEKIMVKSYEEWIAKSKTVVEHAKGTELKQKVLDDFIEDAHAVAKNRMRNLIGKGAK